MGQAQALFHADTLVIDLVYYVYCEVALPSGHFGH